ncbi:MAG: 4-hydroxy-3-methylbut-2-enyl diphosphate reductase [Pseudomonadales bacterium]|nr:4-hydroxy-3-methylbut-2-enyl diphosphate reductase [Pseudomonadales bacterium]
MELFLAQPRGFCAGVVRAVDIVELALQVYKPPIYVFHEIVHNHHVVTDLERKGAVFIDQLGEVPSGAVTIFSAHGVPDQVVAEARKRQLNIIDATCPLVTKVHLQGQRYSQRGYAVVIVGHMDHQEVIGTKGSIDGEVYVLSTPEEVAGLNPSNPEKVAYVTQTTLSLDDTRDVIRALKARFPNIVGPGLDDICYATQNRQNAVRDLAQQVDLVLVVGSSNSSNTNRLRDVAQQSGVAAYLIQDETGIDLQWLVDKPRIGITAGASAPERLVQGVIRKLQELGGGEVQLMDGIDESTVFRLPRQLLEASLIATSQQSAIEQCN